MDYIALAVPVFFILIGIELAYTFYKKLRYYRFNDSISNLSQGIGSQLVGLFMKTILFFGYQYIYTYWRLFDLPSTLLVWIILFIGVDFFYYWFHRLSHEINALWAAHIVHHQSEEYNLTVALRQSWFQSWFSWIFYLPLAWIGFDPLMFVTLSAFNTLYQFWIHTRTIKNMGILEYIINTPSHHRVHHGSNPKYIDKNHAGTLIIWDRLFGTFQKEEEEVYYGITTPLASWNPFWANFHYWAELCQISKKVRGIHKIMVFIKSPGSYDDTTHVPKDVSNSSEKYDQSYSLQLQLYIVFQFLLAILVATFALFQYKNVSSAMLVSASLYVLYTLWNCGVLLEKRKSAIIQEWIRIIVTIIFILCVKAEISTGFPIEVAILSQIISLTWFFIIQKTGFYAQKISGI